jgi:hypothetical protein
MTNFEPDNGTTRDDLVQRVALMEAMITEGRRSTARFGWIFVLWGLIDIAGMVGQIGLPRAFWVWPVAISSGFVLQFIGFALIRRRGGWGGRTIKSRSMMAVWSMMGAALTLYCFTGAVRGAAGQVSFVAAILMIVGLGHAISAVILRWLVQGLVAASWWIAALACFFVPSPHDLVFLYISEMLVGMVFFGLYSMWLERRRAAGLVEHQA